MTYTVVQLDTKILWLFFDLSKVSDGRIVNRQKKKNQKSILKSIYLIYIIEFSYFAHLCTNYLTKT